MTIVGDNVPDAFVEFGAGLTVIFGASNTGKSYVVEALDYMLGGKALKTIPEAAAYRTIMLSVTLPDGSPITLVRSINGGHFGVYSEHLTAVPKRPADLTLALATQSGSGRISLSQYLLQALGLHGKVVRKNNQNVTVQLSFRNLMLLCIVDETKVQSKVSPPTSGQWVNKTVELSVLKLLLQGEDDSKFSQDAGAADRRKVSRAKAEILEQAIGELQQLTAGQPDINELRDQLARIANSIERRTESSNAVLDSKAAIVGEHISVLRQAHVYQARLDEVMELISRFMLLMDKYDSDLARLEMVQEAGTLLGFFRPGVCVFCGAAVEHQAADAHSVSEITVFGDSVLAEIQKTRGLRDDLEATIADLRSQRERLQEAITGFRQTAGRLQDEIDTLDRRLEPERSEMNELLRAKTGVEIALANYDQISRLVALRATVEPEDEEPTQPPPGLNEAIIGEFSRTLADIVTAWSVPVVGPVSYSKSAEDVIVNGQPRSSQGKGMRALLHAAFTTALAQYCLDRDVEHPGFVVLDSPLVTYREPEPGVADAPDPEQFQHVSNSLFTYLDRRFDGQSVIVENTDPPLDLSDDATSIHFTGDLDAGRYGFFPPTVRRREQGHAEDPPTGG